MSKPIVRNVAIGAAAVALVGLILWWTRPSYAPEEAVEGEVPEVPGAADSTHSDGLITFTVPKSDFGLAVKPEQMPKDAYIPPCDPMDATSYCIYYLGAQYAGTNFDSAGLRIKKRADLTDKTTCLETPPAGYQISARTSDFDDHSTSVFFPLGNAAAGHYTTGAEHRLFYQNTCYVFETRIGESQFANYAPGTIREFSAGDRAIMEDKLRKILESVTLKDGRKIDFEPTFMFKG